MKALIDGDIIVYRCGFAAQHNNYMVYPVGSDDWVASFRYKKKAVEWVNGQEDLEIRKNVIAEPLDNALQKITLNSDLAIKIDVEGQEAEIFKGAQSTLKKCEKAVILLEIHPDTLERDGLTPEDLFAAVESIRKCRWYVPLLDKTFDRSVPFFEQFPIQQYDLIGYI